MDENLIFIIIEVVLVIVGLLGSVLPVLPGLPLIYGAMLVQHFFHDGITYPWWVLVIFAILSIGVLILDYFIPVWGTKKMGASKQAVRFSVVGVLVGFFLSFIWGPWMILIGPFAGAIIGELIAGKEIGQATKSGTGAFLGFLAGMMLKLFVGGIMGVIIFIKFF